LSNDIAACYASRETASLKNALRKFVGRSAFVPPMRS